MLAVLAEVKEGAMVFCTYEEGTRRVLVSFFELRAVDTQRIESIEIPSPTSALPILPLVLSIFVPCNRSKPQIHHFQ